MAFVGDLLSIEVPCEPAASRLVRQALATVHDGTWSLEDGQLVASELVTNAIRHSGCVTMHSLGVEIGHHQGNLMISVHDPGLSGDDAEPVSTERIDPGGRGLQIVQKLSVRWGAERPDGYRVWAELSSERELP
jgi:anti-sigma regulatory factor (Ser/Thr protein kinase)